MWFPSHRNHPALMRMIVKLRFDSVTRVTFAVNRLFRRIFRVRIATLDHEILDDAVEDGAVVKTGFGQLLEIPDSLPRSVGPELHHHFSSVRFDHGDFFLV